MIITSDNKYIISDSSIDKGNSRYDSTIIIWNFFEKRIEATIKTDEQRVTAFRITHNDKSVITAYCNPYELQFEIF